MANIKRTAIVLFVALMASACAAPQPAMSPELQGEYHARELLKLMDKDGDGKVSRAEFMSFMSEEFDRLDVNKEGELDVKKLAFSRFIQRTGGSGSR